MLDTSATLDTLTHGNKRLKPKSQKKNLYLYLRYTNTKYRRRSKEWLLTLNIIIIVIGYNDQLMHIRRDITNYGSSKCRNERNSNTAPRTFTSRPTMFT